MSVILASASQAAAATTTTASFQYVANDVVKAKCIIGATPPNQQCQVTLQASLDNVNWVSLETRTFGVQPSQAYYQAFNMSDYVGAALFTAPNPLQVLNSTTAAEWGYFRLYFFGNDTQAVTISATSVTQPVIAVVTLTG